jgi:hypothetical protein
MSEMSQASAPSGGDPLEVMPHSGAKDDVLPGPPADMEAADAATDPPSEQSPGSDDQLDGPAAGEPVNSSTVGEPVDPEAGRDPLDSADTEGARTPGVGGSQGAADPMPDMAGTQPNNPAEPAWPTRPDLPDPNS